MIKHSKISNNMWQKWSFNNELMTRMR